MEKILDFIKHIFGTQLFTHNGTEIPRWEIGLDYIQLLLHDPTQPLPILFLESTKNGTGKTTFGQLILNMGLHNSVKKASLVINDEPTMICRIPNMDIEAIWIIHVPAPIKNNFNLLAEMKDQVPAFLEFLRGRKLVTKNASPCHFHPSLLF